MNSSAVNLAEIAQQFEITAAQFRILAQLPEGQRGGELEKVIRALDKRLTKMHNKLDKTQNEFEQFQNTTKLRLNKLEATSHNEQARIRNGNLSGYAYDAETLLAPLHHWLTDKAIVGLPATPNAVRELDNAQVTQVVSELGWHFVGNENLREKQDFLVRQMGYTAELFF